MSQSENEECVIIPVSDLVILEKARKDLYELVNPQDTKSVIELTNISAIMWKIANKKYPIYMKNN